MVSAMGFFLIIYLFPCFLLIFVVSFHPCPNRLVTHADNIPSLSQRLAALQQLPGPLCILAAGLFDFDFQRTAGRGSGVILFHAPSITDKLYRVKPYDDIPPLQVCNILAIIGMS